jgi:glycosyltransferase involved in cell wall biosynthesis
VVCVSPTWGEGLAKIGNRKIEYISNGFDEEDIHEEVKVPLDEKFTIVHIGMMGKSRNHEVFWKAISELILENKAFANQILIKLYGKLDPSVQESVERNQLTQYVEFYDYIPHNEIIYKQKSAQVLYLSVNDTANAMGILTGKIYEYLAVKRPILCIGPEEGEAAKVIKNSQSGLVSGFHDKEKLKNNLLHFFYEYQQNISFEGGTNFSQYSRKSQTKELAELLNKLVKA